MKIGVDAQTLLEEVIKQDQKNGYDLFLWRLFPKPPVYPFGREKNFSYRYQRFFPCKFFYKSHKLGIDIPLELFFGRHDLKNAVEEILSSPGRRAELSKKGLQNARRFSWEESARKLIGIFERLKD